MVNTRQNQSSQDLDGKMPVKNSNAEDSTALNDRVSDSVMDNDSDYNPRTQETSVRWKRHLRSRYSSNSHRSIGRVRSHPARACRLRLSQSAMDYDDEIDDMDMPYNDVDDEDDDEDDDDDEEPIFSPMKTKRKYSERHSSRRVAEHRSLQRRTSLEVPNPDEESNSKVLENGVKVEDENDQDAEGEGVRRSKRQKKLLYNSFNQSWIIETQTVLRGYPQMYPTRSQTNGENEGMESNDEVTRADVEQGKETDSKPIVNNESDVYANIKRTRRRRIRYSPSNEIPVKSRLRERRPARVFRKDTTETEESQESSDEGAVPRRRRSLRRDDSSDEFNRKPITDTGRVYHLRQNKPAVERFQVSGTNKPTRRSSRLVLCSVRPRRFQSKNRDSTSSDEERFERKKAKSLAKARSRCMPLNYKQSDSNQLQKTPVHSTKSTGGTIGPKGPGDVDPMAVDTSIRFDKVGGLEAHLRCLKEMVVFPMMYREIFEKFKIQPPKGVLFHGPPGTGKTLIARALANECSQGDRKVAFFMRKGADCLSKWVGESERQLRLLFEQAYQMRPSIIFFDEIDGLAPVRSSKQDQIHASIVSTLLALLDGLDDRGEIIVIGATNRIDAIDPALRRPGRFDRELYFPLPGKKEREEILMIHTKPWNRPPSQELVTHLAEKSVGYCGSDLRLLCSEAVVQALRRRYPQIYKSSRKLLLETDAVNVEEEDFKLAQSKIVPASSRVNPSPRARLSPLVAPLLEAQLEKSVSVVSEIFPQGSSLFRNETIRKPLYRPHLLIHAPDEHHGQTSHLAPALLEFMEHVPVHTVNLTSLFEMTNRNSEEAVIQIMREATRNPPSVIYLPSVDKWWDLLPSTTHEIFLERIQSISASSPVFLLGTSHTHYDLLSAQVKSIFKYEILQLRKPSREERKKFFEKLILEETVKPPEPEETKEEDWEELPVAPSPPPPQKTPLEMEELHNQEEHKLRELRIFLRDICSKLARNRQFFMFTKPVDVKEVPDYLSIIKKPMDLETMMTNIDLHRYNSAQEFLSDIDLIVHNALEYNPERDPEDKLIRHRACSLRDTAYTLIKAEMDTDFEEECRKISKRRREKKDERETAGKSEETEKKESTNDKNEDSETNSHPLSPFILTADSKSVENSPKRKRESVKVKSAPTIKSYLNTSERIKRRKKMNWAKGFLKKRVKRNHESASGENCGKSSLTSSVSNSESNTQDTLVDTCQKAVNHVLATPEKDPGKRPKWSSSTSPVVQTSKTPPSTPTGKSLLEETPLKSPKKRRTLRQRRLDKELSDLPDRVTVDVTQLDLFFDRLVESTENCSLQALLDVHSILARIVFEYGRLWDRSTLIEELTSALDKLKELSLVTLLKTDRIKEMQQVTN